MNGNTDDYFASYEEWRDAMANLCKIPLTPEYCTERIQALEDLGNSSTTEFIELFGLPYRDRVIGWFERAGGSR